MTDIRNPPLKGKKYFDATRVDSRRRQELECHANYVGAGDTEDLDRWLILWARQNRQSKDPVGAVRACAARLGRFRMSKTEAKDIVAKAAKIPKSGLTADKVAQEIGVTYDDRDFLGITTIGSCDKSKRQRHFLRKQKKRVAKERKRRERGAKSHADSLERQRPWETLKMSRRTWFRRRKSGTFGTVGTERSPAESYNAGAETVPKHCETSALLTTALPYGRAPSASVVQESFGRLASSEVSLPLSSAGHHSPRHGHPTAVDFSVSAVEKFDC